MAQRPPQRGTRHEVLATHRFDSREALEAMIHRYVWLYNHIPQKALGHAPLIESMKRWYAEKPELFIKIPLNRPGPGRFSVLPEGFVPRGSKKSATACAGFDCLTAAPHRNTYRKTTHAMSMLRGNPIVVPEFETPI
jgi:hypothetical protein